MKSKIVYILLALIVLVPAFLVIKQRLRDSFIDTLARRLSQSEAFITYNEEVPKLISATRKRKPKVGYLRFRERFALNYKTTMLNRTLTTNLAGDTLAVDKESQLKFKPETNKLWQLFSRYYQEFPELRKLTKEERREVYMKAFRYMHKKSRKLSLPA